MPFSPTASISRPAGRSTYVFHLRTALRQGTSDTVEIWTAGNNTVTLARITVPVNCAVLAAAPPATGGATPPSQAVAPPAGLASTGVPEWLLYLSGLGLLGLIIGAGVTFGANRGRRT